MFLIDIIFEAIKFKYQLAVYLQTSTTSKGYLYLFSTFDQKILTYQCKQSSQKFKIVSDLISLLLPGHTPQAKCGQPDGHKY